MESINCGGDTEHNSLPSSAFYQEQYPNLFHTIFFLKKIKISFSALLVADKSHHHHLTLHKWTTNGSRLCNNFSSASPPLPPNSGPTLCTKAKSFSFQKIRSHFCRGICSDKKIKNKIPGITSCWQLSPDQRNTSHFGGLCRESSLMNCSPWGISEKFGLLPAWADQLCMATAPSNRGKAFALSTALNQLSVRSLFISR